MAKFLLLCTLKIKYCKFHILIVETDKLISFKFIIEILYIVYETNLGKINDHSIIEYTIEHIFHLQA